MRKGRSRPRWSRSVITSRDCDQTTAPESTACGADELLAKDNLSSDQFRDRSGEALCKTDAVTRMISRLRKAKLIFRSFDPNEQTTTVWFEAIQKLHLLPRRIEDSSIRSGEAVRARIVLVPGPRRTLKCAIVCTGRLGRRPGWGPRAREDQECVCGADVHGGHGAVPGDYRGGQHLAADRRERARRPLGAGVRERAGGSRRVVRAHVPDP